MAGMDGDMDKVVDTGLARGFRLGDVSMPLRDPVLLRGGDAPPAEDTGERMGDGDRFMPPPAEERLVRPARWIDSLDPPSPAWPWCSAWTTSAKLMKLSRRMSTLSRLP